MKWQGEVHDITKRQENSRCDRELAFNRRGEKTFQASLRKLHATMGDRRRWVVEHDVEPAETIQIVSDGRIL